MQKLWMWRYAVSPPIVPSGNFAELNRTVNCMVLKGNDRRTPSPDEFRRLRSDYIRQSRSGTAGIVLAYNTTGKAFHWRKVQVWISVRKSLDERLQGASGDKSINGVASHKFRHSVVEKFLQFLELFILSDVIALTSLFAYVRRRKECSSSPFELNL
ncbi:hypothetical protein TNCV_349191 [Trichonephila clavipes]|nr:hypothetical protein TNCV_349191 [Trichonephila clavipes]